MTFAVYNFRDPPTDARRFVALDDAGLPYPGIEIGGVRYDLDAWRAYLDTPMPEHHKEREA